MPEHGKKKQERFASSVGSTDLCYVVHAKIITYTLRLWKNVFRTAIIFHFRSIGSSISEVLTVPDGWDGSVAKR